MEVDAEDVTFLTPDLISFITFLAPLVCLVILSLVSLYVFSPIVSFNLSLYDDNKFFNLLVTPWYTLVPLVFIVSLYPGHLDSILLSTVVAVSNIFCLVESFSSLNLIPFISPSYKIKSTRLV